MPAVTKYVPFLRLDSLRNQILLFAVLATVIPSGITLWISYQRNRAALEARVAQELLSQSAQAAREMGVWLKERTYDLRVFASSLEVFDNLDRIARGETTSPTRGRLHDYLRSLHERFGDFEQLAVIDPQGRVVATSARQVTPLRLPDDWMRRLRTDGHLLGDPVWRERGGTMNGILIIGVPIQSPDGRILGTFAALLRLGPVQRLIETFVSDTASDLDLITESGLLVASTRSTPSRLPYTKRNPANLERLLRREGQAFQYTNAVGAHVVGTLRRVPQARWAVVAEHPTEAAFVEVRRYRDLALLVIAGLLIAAALMSYQLARIIVRPLDRLTKGAAEVAAGDLAVDLPEGGAGEVGYLTTVFNDMVARLRASREELERLSLTDGLTGLANRRYLMQRLGEETLRARRSNQGYSVLMADVDHFKQYNDAHGHPAGDEVLRRVANILRDSAREVDCVARYGGEEFCLMLPETPMKGALTLAGRIRERVEAEEFEGGRVTLSIGAASLPANGDTPDSVIAAADEALYAAKRGGRNRVVQASRSAPPAPPPRASRGRKKA